MCRGALMVGCVVGLSVLAALVFAPDHGVTPSSLPVTLAGSADVATGSGVSCTSSATDVVVTGTLVAATSAPLGLTVYATLHPVGGGVSIGESATVAVPPILKGEARKFRGVLTDTGAPAGDRCVVLWVANPAAS
jgi:hypothetical protein